MSRAMKVRRIAIVLHVLYPTEYHAKTVSQANDLVAAGRLHERWRVRLGVDDAGHASTTRYHIEGNADAILL